MALFDQPDDSNRRKSPLDGLMESLKQGNTPDLNAITAQSESGNRDFDERGRPVTSSAGARFAMQVMPATARDPGFGLKPANPNDPEDMNRLGREYRAKMEQRYGGDYSKMWAAYNAGPGRVDDALARYGDDWLAHMPAETRNYVAKNLQAAGSGDGSPGVKMADVRNVRSQGATEGERSRSSAPREYEIIDPFEAGVRGNAAADKTQQRQLTLDETIQAAIAERNTEQERELAALRVRNEARGGIREQIKSDTERLLAAAKPIFQKKQAIADRLGEIADMSPFERMLKGTFDPNYNEDVLTANDQRYGAQLNAMASRYEYVGKLQNAMISQINDEYSSAADVFDVLQQHRLEDLQFLGASVSAAEAETQQLNRELATDSAIESAKNYAITDTVSKMSLGQLNEAETNAVDGRVTVNGIEIPLEMVSDRIDNIQSQEYDMASRAMAIESQNMSLIEQSEDRIISRMTGAEVDAALQNGGEYNGQEFPIDKLATQQAKIRQSRQIQAESAAMTQAPQMAGTAIRSTNQHLQNMVQRAKSLGLSNDPGLESLASQAAVTFRQFTEGYRKAQAGGYAEEFAAQQIPVLQQQLETQQKYTDRLVKTWAGSNKSLQSLGTAWMTGQPINSRDSAEGLLTLARDGLPPGANLTGPALEAYNAARIIVESGAQQQAGEATSAWALALKGGNKKSGFTDEQVNAVLQKSRSIYNSSMTDKAIRGAPQLAREIKDAGGNPHPFSRIRPQDFGAALQLGDAEGMKRVASSMGVDEATADNIFSNPGGAAWQEFAKGREGKEASFDYWASQLVIQQTQATFQFLDQSQSATEDFKPSAAFADIMGNPQFQQSVTRAMQMQRGASFGDYVVGFAAGNGAGEQFMSYANMVPQAYQAMNTQNIADARKRSGEIHDPIKRAKFVLGAIDGLSQQDEMDLMLAIRRGIRQPERSAGALASRVGAQIQDTRVNSEIWSQVSDIVMNQKFEDKRLEGIRKRAAQHWTEYSRIADSGFARMQGDN